MCRMWVANTIPIPIISYLSLHDEINHLSIQWWDQILYLSMKLCDKQPICAITLIISLFNNTINRISITCELRDYLSITLYDEENSPYIKLLPRIFLVGLKKK